MEKLKLSSEYSMKNIPLAAKKQFLKKFVAQQENLLYRMRWKAYFAILKNLTFCESFLSGWKKVWFALF